MELLRFHPMVTFWISRCGQTCQTCQNTLWRGTYGGAMAMAVKAFKAIKGSAKIYGVFDLEINLGAIKTQRITG